MAGVDFLVLDHLLLLGQFLVRCIQIEILSERQLCILHQQSALSVMSYAVCTGMICNATVVPWPQVLEGYSTIPELAHFVVTLEGRICSA